MGYIEESLGANESVRYIGHFHWIHYVLAYGALILSVLLGLYSYSPNSPALAFIAPVIGLVIFLSIMIPIWTTEIGVTSQRVVLKRGLIQRETHELQLRAIEEVAADQSVIGRILGYGKLVIYGTGEQEIRFPAIGDPLEMRRALQDAMGPAQNPAAPLPDNPARRAAIAS